MKTIEKNSMPQTGNKITLANYAIKGGDWFEKNIKTFFKKIYQKKAQKTAFEKFSELNKVALLMKDKQN